AATALRADRARPPSPRQPEDALGDQVALDLGGPAHDRLRAGVEVGAAALLVEHRPRAEHLHRQLLEALVGLAAEHLLDRALHPRLAIYRPGGLLQDPGTGWHLVTGRL